MVPTQNDHGGVSAKGKLERQLGMWPENLVPKSIVFALASQLAQVDKTVVDAHC